MWVFENVTCLCKYYTQVIHVVQLKEPMNISKAKKDELLNALCKNLDQTKQYQNVSEVAAAAWLVQ